MQMIHLGTFEYHDRKGRLFGKGAQSRSLDQALLQQPRRHLRGESRSRAAARAPPNVAGVTKATRTVTMATMTTWSVSNSTHWWPRSTKPWIRSNSSLALASWTQEVSKPSGQRARQRGPSSPSELHRAASWRPRLSEPPRRRPLLRSPRQHRGACVCHVLSRNQASCRGLYSWRPLQEPSRPQRTRRHCPQRCSVEPGTDSRSLLVRAARRREGGRGRGAGPLPCPLAQVCSVLGPCLLQCS